MLEAMLGPDKKKQMMGTGIFLAAAILAFVGMALIVIGSINPIWHLHLWPGIAMLLFAGSTLAVRGKAIKLTLSIIVLLLGLWIVLNVALGLNVPDTEIEIGELISGDIGIPDMMVPTFLQLAIAGGAIGAFGGLVGIYGALKY